jgi:hypothetical protein
MKAQAPIGESHGISLEAGLAVAQIHAGTRMVLVSPNSHYTCQFSVHMDSRLSTNILILIRFTRS